MNYADRQPIILDMLSTARGSGRWIKVNCEFCPLIVGKSDRERSFSFNRLSTGYVCHRCGVRGSLEDPPEDLLEAQPSDEEKRQAEAARRPPESYLPLWTGDGARSEVTREAREYLVKRGIKPHVWKRAQIGACVKGYFAGRIIVPVLDAEEKWHGFGARMWSPCEKRLKYRFPIGMPRGEIFYNHAALFVKTDDPVYVVEGQFDELAHDPDAVASLGEVSELQVEALMSAHRPVVNVFDGDAWEKGFGLTMRLRIFGRTAGCVVLPAGKDPDEVDTGDLWEAARQSLTTDFVRL